MLSHLQGELLNASKLATSLDGKSVTIDRYLDLMVNQFSLGRNMLVTPLPLLIEEIRRHLRPS